MNSPSVHCAVELLGKKYICYTRWDCDEQLFLLVVSDGIDVWRIGLTEEDLDRQRDSVQCSDIDSLMQQIRKAFSSCQLVVDRQADRLTLSVGHWPIQFDLFEVVSSVRKSELQQLIFRLADLSSELETKLQGANSKIEELSQKQRISETAAAAALYEPEVKKRTKQTKVRRLHGTSLINPSSKKKKTAGGVVFDHQD